MTSRNQAALPAYQNQFIGDELHCDEETGHRTDERIARTKESGEASLNTRPIVRNGRGFEGLSASADAGGRSAYNTMKNPGGKLI